MFEESKVRAEWPPLKRAIWDVVTAAELNAPKYVNAYELTDKLFEATKLQGEPVRWLVEERHYGAPSTWTTVMDADDARRVYGAWKRHNDERVTMTPLYAGPLPLPSLADAGMIAPDIVAATAANIAGMVADPTDSRFVKDEVTRILQFISSAGALDNVRRDREAWERGMRDAAAIATQRVEDDPEYKVYPDGDDIARDIREAIKDRKP